LAGLDAMVEAGVLGGQRPQVSRRLSRSRQEDPYGGHPGSPLLTEGRAAQAHEIARVDVWQATCTHEAPWP